MKRRVFLKALGFCAVTPGLALEVLARVPSAKFDRGITQQDSLKKWWIEAKRESYFNKVTFNSKDFGVVAIRAKK